jgi:UDP-2,3-diacylglucosamine hydrolase
MFEFTAPPAWRCIDFASDLHLDGHTPQTTTRLLRYLQGTEADAVFLLGDLFEVWVGAEVLDLPGPLAEIGAALKAASQRLTLGFMAGNRDFLLDAVSRERMGLVDLPDPLRLSAWDEALLLSHGDAWCLDDLDYQRFRAEVRTVGWQSRFLAQPYAQRQRAAADIRAHSEARKRSLGPQAYGDIDRPTAIEHLRQAASRHLVHGHTHRPGDEQWLNPSPAQPPFERHVLSDWDCDHDGPPRAEILRWTAAGLERRAVLADGQTMPTTASAVAP